METGESAQEHRFVLITLSFVYTYPSGSHPPSFQYPITRPTTGPRRVIQTVLSLAVSCDSVDGSIDSGSYRPPQCQEGGQCAFYFRAWSKGGHPNLFQWSDTIQMCNQAKRRQRHAHDRHRHGVPALVVGTGHHREYIDGNVPTFPCRIVIDERGQGQGDVAFEATALVQLNWCFFWLFCVLLD